MQIPINSLRVAPRKTSGTFALCCRNPAPELIADWMKAHRLSCYQSGTDYINITMPAVGELKSYFHPIKQFDWIDGFSPNLNKRLHVGHFANLVLSKAFKQLGIAKRQVSIYGDTLSGIVSKSDARTTLNHYKTLFHFAPDREEFASQVKLSHSFPQLVPGTGEYAGTKVFENGDEKVVGIKSDGSTTYFYQDVALAQWLDAPTIYLTGREQLQHFALLRKFFSEIQHIGMGLVLVNGQKMSSRLGNEILLSDFIAEQNASIGNIKLLYNIFAGYILRSAPETDKQINAATFTNLKNSPGLYISYTMARLRSAGCEWSEWDAFYSRYLEFAELRAQHDFKPNILFTELVDFCHEVNAEYEKPGNTIRGNTQNQRLFEMKLSDIQLACQKLGMFQIDEVKIRE